MTIGGAEHEISLDFHENSHQIANHNLIVRNQNDRMPDTRRREIRANDGLNRLLAVSGFGLFRGHICLEPMGVPPVLCELPKSGPYRIGLRPPGSHCAQN
jgi:hypothetical protein